MTDIQQEASPSQSLAQSNRRWWTLPVISLATLMIVLDATIVNIALPSAQQDLGMSDANRHWVITAYALAFGGLLLVGGRVCGVLGHRRSFAVGLLGFAVSSAVGGAAQNLGTLVGARAAQGVFAALLAPAALSLLTLTFTGAVERGRAFGVFAAVGAGGAALGVVAGGLLTEYADWRWCLYINIPMALLALAGTPLILRDEPGGSLRTLDVPGVVSSTGGLVAMVYAFTQAEPRGWGDSLVVLLLVGGLLLLVLFVFVQTKAKNPLMPLHIVLHRVRGAAFVSVWVMFVSIYGFYLFMSYYSQTILGYSPVKTGLSLLVNAVATIVGSMLIAAKLSGRVAPRLLIVFSLIFGAIGLLILTRLTADSSHVFVAYLVPAQILTGLGLGCLLAVATNLAMVDVGWHEAGIASAAYNAVQQVGAALGTALFNSIQTSVTSSYLDDHGNGETAVRSGVVHGYTVALWVAFGVLALGALAVSVISGGGRTAPNGEREAEVPGAS
ncbi:MFS transporter [Embleya sp. AB8]|uniref:MFS transporter n=1 Tax=Embleya sp. AB8 TaxID=3156304 RepID=UPI003C71568E